MAIKDNKTTDHIKSVLGSGATEPAPLKQFKLNLTDRDVKRLKEYAATKGIGHTTAARMIIVEFLNKL